VESLWNNEENLSFNNNSSPTTAEPQNQERTTEKTAEFVVHNASIEDSAPFKKRTAVVLGKILQQSPKLNYEHWDDGRVREKVLYLPRGGVFKRLNDKGRRGESLIFR
jgi:hypothetical protein